MKELYSYSHDADYAGILAMKAFMNLLTADCLYIIDSPLGYPTFRAKEKLDLSLLDEYERFVVISCKRQTVAYGQILRETIQRIHKADPATQRPSTDEEKYNLETVRKIAGDAYDFVMPLSHCSI